MSAFQVCSLYSWGGPEPVRSSDRKRSSQFSSQPPPHNVLPVRDVLHEFPDIVTFRCGTPCRLLKGDAPNGSAKIGAVQDLRL